MTKLSLKAPNQRYFPDFAYPTENDREHIITSRTIQHSG
jgi:hypothetical protein